MATARKIPGCGGATAERDGSDITRLLREADGSILGWVSIRTRSRIYPYRIVRNSNPEDVLGSNLAEAVETLRSRKSTTP